METMETSCGAQKFLRWKKDLFLNTKGTCFLCLKEYPSVLGGSGTEDEEVSRISLGNICRYLDINPSVVLKKCEKNLQASWDKNEALFQREKCDFSVMLCTSCLILSKKLSELIDQLEMTEMMLNHKIQQFQQVLIKSEMEGQEQELYSRWDKLQEKMLSNCTSPVPVEAGLVEQLRQATKQNCSQKLENVVKTGLPRVRLSRCKFADEVDRPTALCTNKVKNSGNGHVRFYGGGQGTKDPFTLSTLPRRKTSTDIPQEPPSAPESDTISPADWISAMCMNYCKRFPGNQYGCPFCSKLQTETNIRSHLAIFHLDKCLVHAKLPSTPESTFEFQCKQVLRSETVKATTGRRRGGENSARTHKFSCSTCTKNFSVEIGFKYHFILKHFKILEDSLLILQGVDLKALPTSQLAVNFKGPQPQNSLPSPVTPQATPPPSNRDQFISDIFDQFCNQVKTVTNDNPGTFYYCSICLDSYKKPYPKIVIMKHLVNCHPEKFFAQRKLPSLSEESFRSCCKQVLKEETNRGGPDKKHQCLTCNEAFSENNNLNYHLVIDHYDLLVEKIIHSQAGTIKKINSSQSKKFVLETLSIYCPQIEFGNLNAGYKCVICNDRIKAYCESTAHKHFVTVHPEVMFFDKRLHQISEDKFQNFCKGLLKRETIQPEDVSRTGNHRLSFYCSFCGAKKCNRYNLKHHVVLEHYDILADKLRKVQEDFIVMNGGVLEGDVLTNADAEEREKAAVARATPIDGMRSENHREVIPPLLRGHVSQVAKRRTKPKKAWACSIAGGGCGRKFTSKDSLKTHKDKVCSRIRNRAARINQLKIPNIEGVVQKTKNELCPQIITNGGKQVHARSEIEDDTLGDVNFAWSNKAIKIEENIAENHLPFNQGGNPEKLECIRIKTVGSISSSSEVVPFAENEEDMDMGAVQIKIEDFSGLDVDSV